MHVGIIGYWLHPPWNEGMKNTTRNLVEALREYTDLDVSVVSSYDRGCELIENVKYAKSSIIKEIIEKTKFFGAEYDLLLNARMARLMYKLCKENDLDLFHLCFASHSIFSFVSKIILKKPVIAQSFGGIKHTKLLSLLNTPNRIDMHITSSRGDIQSFPFSSKICLINPIINSSIFRPLNKTLAREHFNLPKDDFIVAYMGSLHETRFPLQLLGIIKELTKEIRCFKLLVITRLVHNEYRENFAKTIKSLGIGENVMIEAFDLGKTEKIFAYNAPDLFIFPFQKHILDLKQRMVIDPPITMLETMSCGKPVIASNVLSMPHIIEDGVNGFLVEPDDFYGFKRKIIEVVEGNYDTKKIGDTARETIIRDFNPKKIALEVKEIYGKVINNVLTENIMMCKGDGVSK